MSRGDGIKTNDENINFFLKDRIAEKEYFVGIREGYLNLYYMGASAAKIEFCKQKSRNEYYDAPEGDSTLMPSKFAKGEASFEIHKEYINAEEPCYKKRCGNDDYRTVHFNYYKRIFPDIIKNIKEKQESGCDEKIVQQRIINYTNANDDSEWYYVDMEYIKPKEPTGRFDMIAISREKHDGKYKVALIELKVGSGSYKGIGKKYYDEKYRKKYLDIKNKEECFYKESSASDSYLSFGSGVVGHITNFMRFLSYGKYNDLLKNDIVTILAQKKAMGLLEDSIVSRLGDIKEDELADTPELYLVSYTHNPDKQKEECISDLKKEMTKYIFSENASVQRCSAHSLENLVHKAHIKGIVNPKMEDFLADDTKKRTIHKHTCELNIGEHTYNFHFVFADPSEKDHCNWNFF